MRPGVTRFCCHWASGNIKRTLILKMGLLSLLHLGCLKSFGSGFSSGRDWSRCIIFHLWSRNFYNPVPSHFTQVVWKSSIQPTIVCEYTPPGWAVLNINSFFKDIHANFVHIVRKCKLKTGTKQAAYWQIDTTIPFYACCEPYALSMFRHHNG